MVGEGSVEAWVNLDGLLLVWIFVVAATIQMRSSKAQEEKGFMRTEGRHERFGPKPTLNPVRLFLWKMVYYLNSTDREYVVCGNTTELKNVGAMSRESSLVFSSQQVFVLEVFATR